MKNLSRIVLFSLLCVVGVLVAQDKNQNNNTDPATAKMNKAQKEHLKIYQTYSLSNATKMSKDETKKMFNAFYNPISNWCGQAEKLYEESAAKAKEKMAAAKNPQQKQQLNIISMTYEQAAKACQTIAKSFKQNDQVLLESNIKKYIALERQMAQNRIQFPVREWISSEEGDTALLLQRKYIRQMRQMQQRQPQPQPKRQ
ncbi:MAG: hypothetical protein IKZ46_12040 [Victivallales bacterium]|nr:hypothetical protein [Victivallales bacterium]